MIMESTFRACFQQRLLALHPQLRRALQWLRDNTDELERQDRAATNRLFFDALAFDANGRLLQDEAFLAVGQNFITQGLANQRPDGSFNEHNGVDTSYQAVSILNLAGLYVFSGASRSSPLFRALRTAMEWERAMIGDNGEISVESNARTGRGQEVFDGKPKEVNYPEVALALLYIGWLLQDPTLKQRGERVINWMSSHAH
jgi:hypothetical protein